MVHLYVGTSQATILALSAARVKLFGTDVRKNGIRGLPEIRVYVSTDVHSCINKGDTCISIYVYLSIYIYIYMYIYMYIFMTLHPNFAVTEPFYSILICSLMFCRHI